LKKGHEVVVFDNLSTGSEKLVDNKAVFVKTEWVRASKKQDG